jgi:hypothetical protein
MNGEGSFLCIEGGKAAEDLEKSLMAIVQFDFGLTVSVFTVLHVERTIANYGCRLF